MEEVLDLAKLEEERRSKIVDEYFNSEDMRERLMSRLKVSAASQKELEAQILAWKLCERLDNSAEGCIFFIENFGWTYNARMLNTGHSAHQPFFLYEFQKEAIRWLVDHIENGRDGLIEKSRDMGVTWLTCWVFLWFWLFRDGINLLLGSYKEALVDNRSDDSMFGRLDYALDSLPKWLLPKGFSKKKHRVKLQLRNPVNSNLISGDTMNPDFGRGSRKTAIFFDELGSWDYAKDAFESTGDVTNCRIVNSTPKGFNFYAKLRNSGIDVLTLHWKLHPLKDEQWYRFECSRRSPEEIAQELDISYSKSQEGRVYPEWGDDNVRFGLYEYDENLPLYVSWDFGKEDPTAIIWAQLKNGQLNIIDCYYKVGKNIDFFVPFINGYISSDFYQYTKREIEMIERHKYWKKGTHFGDPAGRNQNQVTDATVLSVLQEHGIVVNFNKDWQPHQKRKRAAKTLIMKGININRNDMTEHFAMCIEQAAYPKVKVQGEEEIRSLKPKHDWTSHFRSSFEYLALGLENFTHRVMQPKDKIKEIPRFDGYGRRRVIRY
jgi:hypothetical protein